MRLLNFLVVVGCASFLIPAGCDSSSGTTGAAGSAAGTTATGQAGTSAAGTSATGQAGTTATGQAGTSAAGTTGTGQAGTSAAGAGAAGTGAAGTGAAGTGAAGTGAAGTGAAGTGAGSTTMSFFVTSTAPGGGNLGGLDGADAYCKMLATQVSAALGAKTWHAYLSTSTVNARDRIGPGPWRNQKGVIIANNLADLHSQAMTGGALNATWPIGSTDIALDEKGAIVPAGGAGGANVHDILTGSTEAGMAVPMSNCMNWTSDSTTLVATVGHSNRTGGNRAPSWNSTHESGGCGNVSGTRGTSVGSGGGRGSFYCFALP